MTCSADPEGEHELCGCGNQPPIHCMWCCEDLTDSEIAICRERDAVSVPHPFVITVVEGAEYWYVDSIEELEYGPYVTVAEAFSRKKEMPSQRFRWLEEPSPGTQEGREG